MPHNPQSILINKVMEALSQLDSEEIARALPIIPNASPPSGHTGFAIYNHIAYLLRKYKLRQESYPHAAIQRPDFHFPPHSDPSLDGFRSVGR
jgi:hypothetical protein